MATDLNSEQIDQIVEWLGAGYTDVDICNLVKRQREKGELYVGQPWPELARQNVRYWRNKYGELSSEMAAKAFDVAISTGLATRTAQAKRLTQATGRVEHTLDRLIDEMDALLEAGVLTGVPYRPQDPPEIIEADYDLDGVPYRPVPAIPVPGIGQEAIDPRYLRLVVLLNTVPKWIREYSGLLKSLRELNPQRPGNDDVDDALTRRDTAQRLYDDIFKVATQPAGVPRR